MDERDDLPTPPQGHLSLEELADLDAGLLSAVEDAAGRAHLADCTTCTAELNALADVGSLIAAAGAVSMPVDVALRLDAALAEEAQHRAARDVRSPALSSLVAAEPSVAAASPPLAPTGSSVVGDLAAIRARRERSTRFRRGAAALVGVAAVLGGGYLFGDTLLSGVSVSTGDDGSSDSPEASSADSGGAAEAPADSGSGDAYTAATLSSDVTRLLEQSNAPVAPVPSSVRELDGDGADGIAQTSRCVEAVAARADSSAMPLAVDVGTFDGVPAVIVVLSIPATSDDVADVWAVSDTCLLPDATGLEVLDRVTLADLPAAE